MATSGSSLLSRPRGPTTLHRQRLLRGPTAPRAFVPRRKASLNDRPCRHPPAVRHLNCRLSARLHQSRSCEHQGVKRLRGREDVLFFVASTLLLVCGGGVWLLGATDPATLCWTAGTVLGLGASIAWTAEAVRRHQLSVDVIAVLALAGALAVDEAFAGAMITVMLASGRLLEARAEARARRELGLLLERSPRTALRRVASGVVEVAVEDVVRGDRLLVGTGALVPVDGRLLTDALLDEAALTGEPLPVERPAGDDVRSGVVNAGAPFDLIATASRRRVDLCGTGTPGGAGAGAVGTVRPRRRPPRRALRPADLAPGRRGVGAQRRSGPRGRGARGRDAMPVAARRPHRVHLRALPGGPRRGGHQGRRGVGAAGCRASDAVRQDRHPDPGEAGSRGRGHRWSSGWTPTSCSGWPRPWTRCPRTCSQARSSPPRRAMA